MHSSYSALVLSRLNGPLPADRALLPGQAAPEDRRGRTIAEWAPNWPELQGLSRLSVQARRCDLTSPDLALRRRPATSLLRISELMHGVDVQRVIACPCLLVASSGR